MFFFLSVTHQRLGKRGKKGRSKPDEDELRSEAAGEDQPVKSEISLVASVRRLPSRPGSPEAPPVGLFCHRHLSKLCVSLLNKQKKVDTHAHTLSLSRTAASVPAQFLVPLHNLHFNMRTATAVGHLAEAFTKQVILEAQKHVPVNEAHPSHLSGVWESAFAFRGHRRSKSPHRDQSLDFSPTADADC